MGGFTLALLLSYLVSDQTAKFRASYQKADKEQDRPADPVIAIVRQGQTSFKTNHTCILRELRYELFAGIGVREGFKGGVVPEAGLPQPQWIGR